MTETRAEHSDGWRHQVPEFDGNHPAKSSPTVQNCAECGHLIVRDISSDPDEALTYIDDEYLRRDISSDPVDYDEAAQRIHRAFCYPDEKVGEWDRSMADALTARGLAIVDANALRELLEGPQGIVQGDDHGNPVCSICDSHLDGEYAHREGFPCANVTLP